MLLPCFKKYEPIYILILYYNYSNIITKLFFEMFRQGITSVPNSIKLNLLRRERERGIELLPKSNYTSKSKF